jgi:iron complex transport system substrate-binding protein
MRIRMIAAAVVATGLGLGLASCGTRITDPDAVPTVELFHAMGMIKVPASPQRVVVLDTDRLDAATTLGVMPVGAVLRPGSAAGHDRPGIAQVGTAAKPDLEKIAELEPDLILGSAGRHTALYSRLSRIAPTVFVDDPAGSWKDAFLLDGLALGQESRAKELLAAYEQRAAEVQAAIPNAASRRISVIGFTPDRIRVYGPGSFAGSVLDDVGLGRPDRQLLTDQADKRFFELGTERIAEVDGDFIFVAADSGQAAERVSAADWAALTAVQAGRTKIIPADIWMSDVGLSAAIRILDDLQAALAG